MVLPILFLLKFVLDIPGPLWLGVNFRRLVSLTVLKVQGHSTGSMATQIWVETVITSSHREAKFWMEPGSVILQNPSLKGYYRTYNTSPTYSVESAAVCPGHS